MVKIENYPNAYKEVYEVLKLVPREDVEKIPNQFMEMVESKMNKDYEFTVDTNIDFVEEQKLILETRAILAYIFLNYWATENQKEIINMKFKKDLEEAEKKKKELYNTNVFKEEKKLEEKQTEEKNKKQPNITVNKKDKLITKSVTFNRILL